VRSATIAGVLSLIALGASMLLLLALHAPGGARLSPQFTVVPSLREWHTSDGDFKFQNGSRIVIDSADAESLNPTAEVLQEDLASLTGRRPVIAQGRDAMPGDVFVTLDTHDDEIGTEGYLLEIGTGVTIRAHTRAGVFYGTRSLLQMLVAGHSSFLSHGWGRDFPQYAERGFMPTQAVRTLSRLVQVQRPSIGAQ
jgi:hexosaminidase